MDVKSSWRKALEEDKAERAMRAVVVNDGVMRRLTPLEESVSLTPGVTSDSNASVSQQGVFSLRSTQPWDTFDSPSATGSGAVQFSLDHETLPEIPSCDSLLSLGDEAVDMRSDDDEELLIPSLKTEAITCHYLARIQQPRDNGSFLESRTRPPERLLTDRVVSEATDKVFSLDLDRLETPSPPKECSLPKLITFSPMDDMKC